MVMYARNPFVYKKNISGLMKLITDICEII